MNRSLMNQFVLLVGCLFSTSVWAVPQRILIIRHAEKPSDSNDPHLSPQGFARAQALKKLFEIHPEYATPSLPTEIFAARFVPNSHSNRAVETVTPLAETLNLKVQTEYSADDTTQLAAQLLQNKVHQDQVILISWKHSMIPVLASALGAPCPDHWDGKAFDRVWLIDFDSSGLTCKDVPQSVMPGDS